MDFGEIFPSPADLEMAMKALGQPKSRRVVLGSVA